MFPSLDVPSLRSAATRLARLVALVSLAAAPWLAQAQPAAPDAAAERLQQRLARPAMPALQLPQGRLQGLQAIQALGDRLPEVAAHYRKSPDQLRALLLMDRRLRLDREGKLFVEEDFDDKLQAAGDPLVTQQGQIDGAFAPLDQTFRLHSRPGARRTVYLNFRGATLSGTAWNTSGSSITAQPFDLDGSPGTFSTTELQRIQAIWQRVAEDFAPFDIDVTTEPPLPDRLTYSGSTDAYFGTTALITHRSGVYSCSCGGVAYIGVFDGADRYKPALVFYDALGGNEKSLAEAISHEVGHNLGLQHDGGPGTAYYAGHGSGATGWAPIMGVGYSRPLTQWSKGEYGGATNTEDDIAVIQLNGGTLRADDHGNTAATATLLQSTVSGGVANFAVQGVIERAGDLDVFVFGSAGGTVSFTLSTVARGANLDARLELRNAAGVVLAAANPVDATNATLSATLPGAGNYHLVVQGPGYGDASSGYSSYGNLGQYALAGSVRSTNAAPTVAITAPANNQALAAGAVVNLTAQAADADGTVQQVRFYDNGALVGTATQAPYAVAWTAVAGTRTLTAQAVDNAGASTTSAAVSVTVAGAVARTQCAVEGGTCTLPAGVTADVYYGANNKFAIRRGVTGSIACTNAVFGDPIYGVRKTCSY
jgi:hypothetical protein